MTGTPTSPERSRYRGSPLVEVVPDDVVMQGLRTVLAVDTTVPFGLVARTANPYASSCPSEIVTVRGIGVGAATLFCKYEPDEQRADWQHRRGVLHEARVYRELLAPLHAPVPRVHGTFRVSSAPLTCLVADAIADAVPVQKADGRIAAAARGLGDFHARAGKLTKHAATFGVGYGHVHLVSWVQRVQHLADEHELEVPWLPAAARAFTASAAMLAASPSTIVHGECYPMNLLATATGIWTVDWESAGVGPGEIDLAALTMGWPPATVAECLDAYSNARWRGTAPVGLSRNLAAARWYLCLRMLGDYHDRSRRDRAPFFDYLADQARACGFLPHRDDA